MKVLDDAIAYIEHRPSAGWDEEEKLIGRELLWHCLVNLILWLWRRPIIHRSNDSLELNEEYPWCRAVPQILRSRQELKQIFETSGGNLTFASSLNPQERERIKEYVRENYQPPPPLT